MADAMNGLLDIGAIQGVDTKDHQITLQMKPPKLYKNIEMEQMIGALEKHLDRTDMIGYAAARNTRILMNEAREYFERREKLIQKYGKDQVDDKGNPTGRKELRFDSPEFKEYSDEIQDWALIEHSPNLFKIPASECIGKLSGRDMLDLEWMLEDEDA